MKMLFIVFLASLQQLANSLNNFDQAWKENPGDGAFYGPKIDITIKDALKRAHQCATIQLDFQLPIRFDLNYTDDTGEKKRPVIIHRAILGSVERMIAILTESCAGKWPFWISPRQVCIVPVTPGLNEYAMKIKNVIHENGYQVEADIDDGDTLNKKIRNAQLAQFNFILGKSTLCMNNFEIFLNTNCVFDLSVLGEREKDAGTVNVRTRDNKVLGERTLIQLLKRFKELSDTKALSSEDSFD